MTFPNIPFFPRHLTVDMESLKQFEAERLAPPVVEQPRDEKGQYKSPDLPVSQRNDY